MDAISTALHNILHYSFVDEAASPNLYNVQESLRWLLISAGIFIPLSYVCPGKPKQPKFRKDMLADGIYWFFGPFFYHRASNFIIFYLLISFYAVNTTWLNREQQSVIATWPVWVQCVIMLLAADFLQYWVHRAFHKYPLWKFHAIHHSPPDVDWMTSVRFHPVNLLLYSTLMNSFVYLLGFSPAAYDSLFVFNSIYSPLVHANLNWTYGPFKYVLASPVFHRWHHTYPEEGGDKNFAPTFPFLDVMFGTFYMPEGKQPETFGAPHDAIDTEDFLQQMLYPFLPAKKPKAETRQDSLPTQEIKP